MSTLPLIAVIEDEEHLAQGLLFNLQAEGYRAHHESDGDSALLWLLEATGPNSDDRPAAILLDVMLPGRDGFSIVRSLREAGRYTPVLLLTARGRAEDIVEGFAAGADDYLPKPFDLNILFARLSGLLRRMHWHSAALPVVPSEPETVVTRELNGRTIRFESLEIETPEKTIHLTLMEADLLRYLLDHPDRIIPTRSNLSISLRCAASATALCPLAELFAGIHSSLRLPCTSPSSIRRHAPPYCVSSFAHTLSACWSPWATN
jgi:DNA-binding response OmpR family regulator